MFVLGVFFLWLRRRQKPWVIFCPLSTQLVQRVALVLSIYSCDSRDMGLKRQITRNSKVLNWLNLRKVILRNEVFVVLRRLWKQRSISYYIFVLILPISQSEDHLIFIRWILLNKGGNLILLPIWVLFLNFSQIFIQTTFALISSIWSTWSNLKVLTITIITLWNRFFIISL